jgi:hypothetical protein
MKYRVTNAAGGTDYHGSNLSAAKRTAWNNGTAVESGITRRVLYDDFRYVEDDRYPDQSFRVCTRVRDGAEVEM